LSRFFHLFQLPLLPSDYHIPANEFCNPDIPSGNATAGQIASMLGRMTSSISMEEVDRSKDYDVVKDFFVKPIGVQKMRDLANAKSNPGEL
jgi:hypothetical protein